MNESDYQEAWGLISDWRASEEAREAALAALRESPRRPHIVIAMLKIAAMLSNSGDVQYALSETLSGYPYAEMESGILNLTDQILAMVDADDSPENEGVWETLASIPSTMAAKELDW